jgi:sugar/nucleoside kinase (ribokinase family)
VGRVGDDPFGPATIENFISHGIDASRVLVTPGVSSGVDAAADLLRRADMIVLQLEIPLE